MHDFVRPYEYPVVVVIPTYNRAHVVSRAIDSVLAQTVADQCGIVVVDDGGADNTADVVGQYGERVLYIRQQNGGLSAARNAGVRNSRSELVAFLDDDDEFTPDKVERQMAVFKRWPEVVMCTGRVGVRFGDQPPQVRPAPDLPLDRPFDMAPYLFEESLISVPTIMVRRKTLEAAGLLDGEIRRGEDYHIWLRLACRGPSVYLDAHLGTFTADSPDGLTRLPLRMFNGEFRVRRRHRAELLRRPDCAPAWRRGFARSLAAARDLAYRQQRFGLAAHYGVRSLMIKPWGRAKWEWARPLLATARWLGPEKPQLSDQDRKPEPPSRGRRTRPAANRPIHRVLVEALTTPEASGGGAQHLRGLCRGLRNLGWHVTALCTGDPPPPRDPDFDKVIVHDPRSVPGLWRVPPLGSLPSWARAVRDATAEVDGVVALSPVMATLTRWLRPSLPLLYAPAVLDKVERPDQPRAPLKWFEQRAFALADRLVVASSAVREAIETLYGPIPAPVGTCPLGVSVAHATTVRRTRRELGVPDDAKLILTIGHLNENKGQRYIADALRQGARDDWHWVALGDGPDGPTIWRTLDGAAVKPRVRLAAKEASPADWLAAADVVVSASRHETFGLAVAEALVAGTPVIVPQQEVAPQLVALSPLAEFVTTCGVGFTYRRGDADDLLETLRTALGNRDRLRAMGRRATTLARANFDWDRYARCVAEMFNSTVDVTYRGVLAGGVATTDSAASAPRTATGRSASPDYNSNAHVACRTIS